MRLVEIPKIKSISHPMLDHRYKIEWDELYQFSGIQPFIVSGTISRLIMRDIEMAVNSNTLVEKLILAKDAIDKVNIGIGILNKQAPDLGFYWSSVLNNKNIQLTQYVKNSTMEMTGSNLRLNHYECELFSHNISPDNTLTHKRIVKKPYNGNRVTVH